VLPKPCNWSFDTGGQGTVAVGVVLVLFHQLAVFGHLGQAVAVIVFIPVLVDGAVRQGFGFANQT
jgi:hypothetical protein